LELNQTIAAGHLPLIKPFNFNHRHSMQRLFASQQTTMKSRQKNAKQAGKQTNKQYGQVFALNKFAAIGRIVDTFCLAGFGNSIRYLIKLKPASSPPPAGLICSARAYLMPNFYYPGKKRNNKSKKRESVAKVGSKVSKSRQQLQLQLQLISAQRSSSQFGSVQFSSVKFGSDARPVRTSGALSWGVVSVLVSASAPHPDPDSRMPIRPCLLHIMWPTFGAHCGN